MTISSPSDIETTSQNPIWKKGHRKPRHTHLPFQVLLQLVCLYTLHLHRQRRNCHGSKSTKLAVERKQEFSK
ncbi:unnamed protein product [Cylicocyclus nassatus]|uniref:Uncharacterized protein n=1 Tax=Cylicocyclus nassatus TaxID=53992 RepID=A0AA36M705_CYLNA|nr:unnamed protein product [Cylicocyclus nassatus]